MGRRRQRVVLCATEWQTKGLLVRDGAFHPSGTARPCWRRHEPRDRSEVHFDCAPCPHLNKKGAPSGAPFVLLLLLFRREGLCSVDVDEKRVAQPRPPGRGSDRCSGGIRLAPVHGPMCAQAPGAGFNSNLVELLGRGRAAPVGADHAADLDGGAVGVA